MLVTILIVLTVFAWGVAPILDKIALTKSDPLSGIIIRSLVLALAALGLMLITGKTRTIITTEPKSILLFATTALLAGFLAMITYYWALKLAPASKIVPLAAVYPLVSAILAIFFLKEQITLARLIGTVLIISGLWLVK